MQKFLRSMKMIDKHQVVKLNSRSGYEGSNWEYSSPLAYCKHPYFETNQACFNNSADKASSTKNEYLICE